jgi:DNA-binding response OmpR family regulator
VPRILVVDDEPLVSVLIENWLTELGCEVVGPAHTVAEGLILADGGQLDGAILDVNIGNETCYSIARALRALGVPLAIAALMRLRDLRIPSSCQSLSTLRT